MTGEEGDMEEIAIDLAVIGSGPAGQKAAIQANKLGKSVIVIEKYPAPGGNCLNTGTIPSKSLREAILDLSGFQSLGFYDNDADHLREVKLSDLNFRLSKVIEEERRMICRQFHKNKIRLLQGLASFEKENELLVLDVEGQPAYRITAKVIVIATGSKPRTPQSIPFDKDVILDSSRLLQIEKVPKTMLVLGGGIIGSEYASFFAALGTKVVVVDKREHMLPLLDSEIGIHLQDALKEIDLEFFGGKKPLKIERREDRAYVTFEDGDVFEADVLLYALGRVANVDDLRLQNVGINLDSSGHVPVNALFQTTVPNIYAVGDVIGAPALASTSMEQGRLAARHAFGAETHHFPDFYPIGIYTIPEISCCGYTEEQLQDLGFHYEVGRAYYYELGRSHISGAKVGMFKILFHAETLEILGVHIIGRGATELIHTGQVAMSFNAHVDYFINQVFNYPTFAEGYRVAALNGYNKLKHLR